jgi:hypothetical protein
VPSWGRGDREQVSSEGRRTVKREQVHGTRLEGYRPNVALRKETLIDAEEGLWGTSSGAAIAVSPTISVAWALVVIL